MMMMVPVSAVRDDRADGRMGEEGLDDEARDNLRWCTKLAAIVEDGRPRQKLPCRIFPHVYLGSKFEAMDIDCLRRHGITSVLNMAAGTLSDEYDPEELYAPLRRDAGTLSADDDPQLRRDAGARPPFAYLGIAAEDEVGYELLDAHFDQAKEFIDAAHTSGGRVLVHCGESI